ncbi:MAG: hypothetical protein AMXMBFR64_12650 [Myxococcales bacterium]
MSDWTGLPGADLVTEGLRDLEAGRESVVALLVAVATTRLRGLGVPVPAHGYTEAELLLYRALCREVGDAAYGRYNSLLGRLISFVHALDREEGRLRAGR